MFKFVTATLSREIVPEKVRLFVGNSQERRSELGSLTAVRLGAALLVVLLHSSSMLYPQLRAQMSAIAFGQTVAFFFVLSGFVLTYIYAGTDRSLDSARFFRARFARIYPLHLLCLGLVFFLSGPFRNFADPPVFFANLFLLQSWIPSKDAFLSYNAPAWSLSCEFFFYICFPFLISNFQSTWKRKLALSASMAIVMVSCAIILGVPMESEFQRAGIDWFVYISPLSRLFEFVLGMYFGMRFLQWQAKEPLTKKSLSGSSVAKHSLLEFFLLAMTLACLFIRLALAQQSGKSLWASSAVGCFLSLPQAVILYFANSGFAPLYALLFYTLAKEHGLVSRLLSHRFLVYLGELTFPLYLLHLPVVLILFGQLQFLTDISPALLYLVFWLLTVSLALIVRELFDYPLPRLLVGRKLKSLTTASLVAIVLGSIGVSGCSMFFCGEIIREFKERQGVSSELLAQLQEHSLVDRSGIKFGDNLALESVNLVDGDGPAGGATLRLTWRSLKGFWLDKSVIVHLLDAKNSIVGNKDYVQRPVSMSLPENTVWSDSILLSAAEVKSAARVGLGLCIPKPWQQMNIDSGWRDVDNKRLLVALPEGKVK